MPDLGHFATCFAESPGLLADLAEIPIAVTGSWVKDGHRFSITKEDLDDIVKNFAGRQNGQVVIDYEHASERPDVAKGDAVPASGWIHSLSTKHDKSSDKDTLWASVEWTPRAKEMIQGGEYRFFSPAIDWGASDKKTGRSKGATLTSGALTNHPFLEELPAIQLSDTAAKPMGKTIVVPVVDNAKIKVKVDAKKDGKTENKTSLTDVSFDQTRSAVSDAINEKYKRNLSYPDLCECTYFWIKELYDSYAIIEADGKMFKIPYSIDKDQNVEIENPVQVVTQYVTASVHTLDETTKSEGDGDHPSSHYLVVEDPEKSTTWHLRVKDTAGKNDHGLMGAAWAALHDGYRGKKYSGPNKSTALTKLKSLYKSEGMKTPDQQKQESSEVKTVKMTDAQFSEAVLKQVVLVETAKKGKTLCRQIRKAATPASDGTIAMKDLVSLSLKLLDDMDEFGVDGDTGEQESLRKEAEKRAAAIDTPSDDDETETLSAKKAGENADDDDDDEDEADGPSVPKFSIRKIKAEDKVGKTKHHAIIGKDGKMAGYITHGDMMAHAKKIGMKAAEAGRSEGTLKASEQIEAEIQKATGRKFTMSEVTKLVERGVTAGDATARSAAHKLMLSTAVNETGEFNLRVARRLLAEDKVSRLDYADFEDAFEDVSNAIKDGRFLPKQRGALISLCLSDRAAFEQMLKDQPKSERLSQIGVGGTGEESADPAKELESRILQYQKENGGEKEMPYKTAYTRVLASDSQLAARYRANNTKLM